MKETVLTSLFTRLRNQLRLSARRFVADEEVDDLLQDAFVKLWGKRSEIETESEITHSEGLIFQTVKNLGIDNFRRSKTRGEGPLPDQWADEPDNSSETSAERRELYSEVSQLISTRLSERDRMILLRRDRDGWEFDEIAEATGLDEHHIRTIVSRSRKTIRNLYRELNK